MNQRRVTIRTASLWGSVAARMSPRRRYGSLLRLVLQQLRRLQLVLLQLQLLLELDSLLRDERRALAGSLRS